MLAFEPGLDLLPFHNRMKCVYSYNIYTREIWIRRGKPIKAEMKEQNKVAFVLLIHKSLLWTWQNSPKTKMNKSAILTYKGENSRKTNYPFGRYL